ncbi:glutathionylspermidine synthase [Salmonella enterica subsp. enterica]|uniref:Glutathionylspermidine synthase n=1 Tax=Salmonella enterica I TaxID=59201 RepID=A0A447N3W4_SALET|nr:glutathionylspermidine synthase [Salmonella enterica subsp. enterica]
MSKGTTSQDAPFGTLLGYAPGGVAIYSSDYNSLDPWDDDDAAFRSYIDDEYMGHKMAVRGICPPFSLSELWRCFY